ncbi:MAG: site-specific DNA-methyltransferase, partial [Chloroflexi bacterium]|nr:site-specific DNA-methyltransferase [Chloroflexota bacterium]
MPKTKFLTDQVIRADCLQALQTLPDASVDLVVFSPPYDAIRDYKKNWQFDFHSLGVEL